MKSLVKLLAGALLGLCIVVSATIPFAKHATSAVRVAQEDRIQTVKAGDSSVYFHFERPRDAFELHVMIVNKTDAEDILQTRIPLKDGQRFSIVLRDEDQDDDQKGHRISFDRVGHAIVVETIEAKPETMFASIIRPFD